MRRKALLIGNSRGLAGVKRDMVNFSNFLTGLYGGAWKKEEEIVMMMNPTLVVLRNKLNAIKTERNDFVIVLFSGHGGYQRGTVLEINEHEETIYDNELMGLASRQISIFDCCRAMCDYTEKGKAIFERKTFSMKDSVDTLRLRYEQRIMQGIPQQNVLYACKIGQCAWDHDDGTGAYYLNNLIKYAQNNTGTYGLVGNVHEDATQATTREVFRDHKELQEPVASLHKCLSSQQLIISMRP